MIGIYKITNPSGKIYIGKTSDYKKRLKYYYKLNCKQQVKIYNSLKKHGPENHIFEIIEECSIEQLNEREIYWINEFKSVETGLNLTYGGDGGNLSKESKELKRLNSMKSIYQFDLNGNFIKKHRGASEAINDLNKGNSNNINDCARGKYKSAYGFQWVYEIDMIDIINPRIKPIKLKPKGSKWTEERRVKTKDSRRGEKRSQEYANKIKLLKEKLIYQIDINNNIINIFCSFNSMNGSKIIGTTKLRQIINKDIFYEGYKYSYFKPNNIN